MKGLMGQLVGSTLIVTLFSLFNILVSFVLQMVIASTFGAGAQVDAYLAASTIPQFVTMVLVGSVTAVFVPLFIERGSGGSDQAAWRFASITLNFTGVFVAVICGVGILVSPWLVAVLAPGFDAELRSLTVHLLRVLFPSVVFGGLGTLLSSVYYARRQFAIPSVGPVLSSLGILASVAYFSPTLGIRSIAIGTLVGSVLQFLWVVRVLRGNYKLEMDLRDPGFLQIVKLGFPLVWCALFAKASTLVERVIASNLPQGSISYLGYARKVFLVLATLTSQGLSASLFPLMSQYAAEGAIDRLRVVLIKAVRLAVFISVPVAVVVASLRLQLVEVFLEQGAFGHESAVCTSSALGFYMPALVFATAGSVVAQAYYVLQDTKTLALLGTVQMIAYYGYSHLFARWGSFSGLAMSTSVYFLASCLVNALVLQRRIGGLISRQEVKIGVQVGVASIAAGLVARLLESVVSTRMPSLVSVGVSGLGAAIAYAGITLWGFRIPSVVAGVSWLRGIAMNRVTAIGRTDL